MKSSWKQREHEPKMRGSKALCCDCRFSTSSSEEADSSESSERQASISSLAHAMVQDRLNQMTKERLLDEAERKERRRPQIREKTRFVVMVAMEKCSDDPREDFRDSIVEMIMAYHLQDPKELRTLLNYYVSINSQEHHSLIMEVFLAVCASLFLKCKFHL